MTYDYTQFENDIQTGAYQSWETPGDQLVGTVVAVRNGEDFNGNPCPELAVDTHDDREPIIVTAGQTVLKREIVMQAPQTGDRIRITYTGDAQAKPGKRGAKLFTVEVQRNTGTYNAPSPRREPPAPTSEVPADEQPF